jgi:hypothetical protein
MLWKAKLHLPKLMPLFIPDAGDHTGNEKIINTKENVKPLYIYCVNKAANQLTS